MGQSRVNEECLRKRVQICWDGLGCRTKEKKKSGKLWFYARGNQVFLPYSNAVFHIDRKEVTEVFSIKRDEASTTHVAISTINTA